MIRLYYVYWGEKKNLIGKNLKNKTIKTKCASVSVNFYFFKF